MMKKLSTCLGIGVFAASMAVAAPSVAAAKYDPESGTGYVSKGEVQAALGWNNEEFQANAVRIDFNFRTYRYLRLAWTCTEDGGGGTLERESFRHSTSYGRLTTTPQGHQQVVGFKLSDPEYLTARNVPAPGLEQGSCPESWTAGDVRSAGIEDEWIGLYMYLDNEIVPAARLEV